MPDTEEMMAVAAQAPTPCTKNVPHPHVLVHPGAVQQLKPSGGLYIALSVCSVLQLALFAFEAFVCIQLLQWGRVGPLHESRGWVTWLLATNGVIASTVAIAVGSACGIALGMQWLRQRHDPNAANKLVRSSSSSCLLL